MITRLSFFATSDEQFAWLASVLPSQVDWCVADEIRPERRAITLTSDRVLSFLESAELGEMRLFLGRRDLSVSPVWRATPVRQELDAVRSRAIHFVPAFAVNDILVEGRIDILDEPAYLREGVDPHPLQAWYSVLRKSFRNALGAQRSALATETDDSRKDRVSTTVFSPGALSWFKGGGSLKQFLESNVVVTPPLARRA
jgi:hypothetical protein